MFVRNLPLTCIASSLFLAGLTVTACSANVVGSTTPQESPNDDHDDDDVHADDDDDDDDHDVPSKKDAGSDRDGGPSEAGPDASHSSFDTDPLNCGAKGRSCLGATCSAGICKGERLRNRIARWLSIDDDGSLLSVVDHASPNHALLRGATTPNAPDTQLFTANLNPNADFRYASGSFFDFKYVGGSNTAIQRWRGNDGGAPATPSTVVTVSTGGTPLFDADDTHVFYYWSSGGIRRVEHDGQGDTLLFRGATEATEIVTDASNVYLLHRGTTNVTRVPKSGGAPQTLSFTGLPNHRTSALAVTSSRAVFALYDYAGIGNCQTYANSLYSAPINGGAATLVATAVGYSKSTKVYGDDVYWLMDGCPGSPDRIYRRRTDGTGALVTVAESSVITSFTVDATYVYASDTGGVFRVAR